MINRAIFALLALAAMWFPVAAQAADIPPQQPILIENVTIIPMTEDGTVLRGRTVLIEEGRISAIENAGYQVERQDLLRVDGEGKWLIPGLSDMHVHIGNDRLLRLLLDSPAPEDGSSEIQDLFTPFVANGVLQIFDLAAMPETVGQRIEIESGRVLGPHIAMAAMIDGADPIWPIGMTRAPMTPDDARQAVRDAAGDGYQFIKVYSRVELPIFMAIVEEARAHDMRVVGHIPQRGEGITGSFFQPGYALVVHAEEFAQQTNRPDQSAIPAYVEMARGNGTWLVSTLTANDRMLEIARDPETLRTREEIRLLPPAFQRFTIEQNPYARQSNAGFIAYVEQIIDFNGPLVRAFNDAEIPVLTGTDSGVPGIVPGFSLHDEFEALSRAGLDNMAILEASTRLPAQWLGVDNDRGTIAVGMRADLVLLSADPLATISNTRQIAAVIRDGRYLSRENLDARIEDMRRRNGGLAE